MVLVNNEQYLDVLMTILSREGSFDDITMIWCSHLLLPLWHHFLPELLLQGKGRAGSHEPAVAQCSLVEVCAAQTLNYQVRVVTQLLVREREREGSDIGTDGVREGREKGGQGVMYHSRYCRCPGQEWAM